MEKKSFTPEEIQRLEGIVSEYGRKPIPKTVYDTLADEMGRTKSSLSSAIYGLRKGDNEAPAEISIKKVKQSSADFIKMVEDVIAENIQLKKQLRALKDVRAAVEKFQVKEV